MKHSAKYTGIFVALGLWLLVPYLYDGSLSIFVTIALYVPIVVGLSVLAGFAGQVSLGQAAFFGMGAYVTGILSASYGWSPWFSIPMAVVTTTLVAFLLGAPVLFLRAAYLVIATLGLNVIFVVVVRELTDLTGGASGLSGIPALQVGEAVLGGDAFYFYAGTALSAVAIILSTNLLSSRFGRALQAIEASEAAAESLAIEGTRYKTAVFAWSAALAGAAGTLYAHWVTFLSPSPFAFDFSVILLLMAVLGGIASIPGAVFGTVFVEWLREWLRDVMPQLVGSGGSAEYEIVVFGILLVTILVFAQQGLWPRLVIFFQKLAPRLFSAEHVQSIQVEPVTPPLKTDSSECGSILEVDSLRRQFGGLTAVDNVSFAADPGTILGLIGPNGAGKTTLLNLISGMLTLTSGEVTIAGERVDGRPAHRIARDGVSRTFQTPRLFPLLSVLDNVKVGMHRHQRSGFYRCALRLDRREERQATAEALGALELVGIADKAHEYIGSLPFGGQRLVELARALVSRPRLLLLDEPASGLTASERDNLGTLIRKIQASGITVILVEHNVKMVTELADRILVIHHGELIADDAPEVTMQDPTVVSAYLGTSHRDGGSATETFVPGSRQTDEPTPSEPEKLLEVRDVSAGYGPIRVLHDVSLEVGTREIVALLGRNGAGKSTLMRTITGLLAPMSGDAILDDKSLAGLSTERIASMGLALVPEGRELLGSMSVEDHLRLGAYRVAASNSGEETHADLDRVYELFPILEERSRQAANSMSGGQQQMLAVARALMARPRVLLLDEPLLGLAPKIVDELLETISRLQGDGIGILIVEQNAAAVLEIVNRAYVLETGRIVLSDTAQRLLESDELKAAFLGRDIRPAIAIQEVKDD